MSSSTETQRNHRLERTITRVLDSLDKQDERLSGMYAGQRQHSRHDLRMMATVTLPGTQEGLAAQSLHVWVRNISGAGMSFIYPQEIKHKHIIVGIDSAKGGTTWFNAEVMRARPSLEEFWEYGVAFRERACN